MRDDSQMAGTESELRAAYAEVERITRDEAKNFAWGIRLLPAPKRNALSAVYAMARRIDDIGDGDLPNDKKLELLAAARAHATSPADFPDDQVCVALADAAQRLPIPLGAFGELVDGCEMDVLGRSYDLAGTWFPTAAVLPVPSVVFRSACLIRRSRRSSACARPSLPTTSGSLCRSRTFSVTSAKTSATGASTYRSKTWRYSASHS